MSTDTAVEASYAVHLGLATLKALEPARRMAEWAGEVNRALARNARTGRRTIGSPAIGIRALVATPNCAANGSGPGREPARTIAVYFTPQAKR